jgi:kinesin family protein 3/17
MNNVPLTSPENVRVFVRCRPLLSYEASSQCISTNPSTNEIILQSTDAHKPSQKLFAYDGVFDSSSTQERVYEDCVFALVENVLEGYNATIFAYGQTGSGKTYSMLGDPESESLKGIIPRSCEHIMNLINVNSEGRTFFVTASFLEIYNEEIHDLLKKTADKKPTKCELRENADRGFYVRDLSQMVMHSTQDLLALLNYGSKQRAVGATNMNEKSSRSHSIFNIRVESSIEMGPGIKPKISVGKLNLVDLAGSERQNKTQSQNERFKEAIKINLSLSALGNVISALADGKTSHIPYRDSKLTKLLQDSLGGNAKTLMLANINPCVLHYDETLGTLRYASRTKMIKNKPKLNEDPKDALIRNYMDEIQKLKEMLERNAQGAMPLELPMDQELLKKMMEEESKQKEKALKELEETKVKEFEDFKEKELKEKERIREELKEKEEGFEKMRMEKANLEQLLLEKEQVLLHGRQVPEDASKLETMRKRIK